MVSLDSFFPPLPQLPIASPTIFPLDKSSHFLPVLPTSSHSLPLPSTTANPFSNWCSLLGRAPHLGGIWERWPGWGYFLLYECCEAVQPFHCQGPRKLDRLQYLRWPHVPRSSCQTVKTVLSKQLPVETIFLLFLLYLISRALCWLKKKNTACR